jgi:hypothetical protein
MTLQKWSFARGIDGRQFCSLCPAKGLSPATFQERAGIDSPIDFDQFRHDAGPPGLMAGADTSAVVAMKILVELQVIPPIRIRLKLLSSAKNWPPTRLVTKKNAG